MTKPIFFDTDCISAFLWVGEQNIVATLYPNNIVIPKQVYDELSNPRISHLKSKIDLLISNNEARIEEISMDTPEYETYIKLSVNNISGRCIGRGEAASIALAKEKNGIVASNNLRDVKKYVDEYSLSHITTGDIMTEAFDRGLIDENTGNIIWAEMIKKRRKLGANSFTDYLRSKNR